MRWTQALIPTLREDPQEAEIVSHRLLLRAGMIRRVSGGLYTFLPLGLRALRKVERVIREEMDRAGALEILMPALQPRELWDRSQRFQVMGDAMFRLRDRQSREMVLGPTHEEVVTDLVAREISSYRQLPRTFYQVQTKFRDEIRPRFGLMRAKEFVMKDAYSFDAGWDEADASYRAMYDAYVRIFKRCGLRTRVVEADTGAMGGKWSHEFMVLADSGEDGIVECAACGYAANLERAERAPADPPQRACADVPAAVATPGVRTIEEVAGFLRCPPEQLVKTLVFLVDGSPVAVLVPGNRDANDKKVLHALQAVTVELADDATIERVTGAPVGFAGPVGLGIPVFADAALRGARGIVTGANRSDTHLRDVDLSRDASVAGYHDLCLVTEGDACPRCEAPLRSLRGIEVGHVFKLGTKYSDAFGAEFLDDAGNRRPLVMGCYGIGVTRTLQAIVEQRHDANGICWPVSIAPYPVGILQLDAQDPEVCRAASTLADAFRKRNIDVLVDDRDERPGVKFKDADLIGFPVRLVVGRRALDKGGVELKMRAGGDCRIVAVCDAVPAVLEQLALDAGNNALPPKDAPGKTEDTP